MKIIITKRFKKKFLKEYTKYFSKQDLVNILRRKEKFIALVFPFLKFKWKINSVDFRWVVFSVFNNSIVPIFIALKKDKKHWENISWAINKDFLKEEFILYKKEIANWDFEIFE